MIRIDYSLSMQANLPGGLEESALAQLGSQIESGAAGQRLREHIASDRYAFANCLDSSQAELDGILEQAAEWQRNFDRFVVVGIGGSNLGNMVVERAFAVESSRSIAYLDNVEPFKVAELLGSDLSRTLFNIITKSGTTSETMAHYLAIRSALNDQGLDPRRHLVFTTDPARGLLREIGQRDDIRCFDIPPQLGGRFSVLSPVGLLSSAFAGADIRALVQGALQARTDCERQEWRSNPGYLLAVLCVAHLQAGRSISVFMPYSDRLHALGLWYRQLWAESLGKRRDDGTEVGQTPVAALGTVDQHSQVQLYMEGPKDKFIQFVRVEQHDPDVALCGEIDYFEGVALSELLNMHQGATEMALLKQGRPSVRIDVPRVDERVLGYLFYTYMMATVAAGELLGVNPIDQPGVEEGKQFVYGLLGRSEYAHKAREYDQLRASVVSYSS